MRGVITYRSTAFENAVGRRIFDLASVYLSRRELLASDGGLIIARGGLPRHLVRTSLHIAVHVSKVF
jgi:hypothetical protein